MNIQYFWVGFGNAGEKFKYAAQCERICTVRPQWLFDSVAKQEVQPESEYYIHPEGMITLIDCDCYAGAHPCVCYRLG